MDGRCSDVQALVADMMRRLPELSLPPITDWDFLEHLMDASQEDCLTARSRMSAWAALFSMRNALDHAGNRQLADELSSAIDRRLTELRSSVPAA